MVAVVHAIKDCSHEVFVEVVEFNHDMQIELPGCQRLFDHDVEPLHVIKAMFDPQQHILVMAAGPEVHLVGAVPRLHP